MSVNSLSLSLLCAGFDYRQRISEEVEYLRGKVAEEWFEPTVGVNSCTLSKRVLVHSAIPPEGVEFGRATNPRQVFSRTSP